MKDRIQVLVVDNHRVFAEALVMLLNDEADLEVTGSVTTAEEALASLGEVTPDVVLMDVDLPGIDGIEATRLIRQGSDSIGVVVLSAHPEPGIIARAIEVGACGFVPKTDAPDQLVRAIRRAAARDRNSPRVYMREIRAELQEARRVEADAEVLAQPMSPREVQILRGIAQGKTTAELADALGISSFTVATHVKNILGKLGVHSRLEAVTFGFRHGLIGAPGRAAAIELSRTN